MHIDMDAFFASIEQVDNPSLKGKPVIVGEGKRGVVSTASYEARAFGVKSAMPIFQAKKLCPLGICLPVRMSRYQEISAKIMSILDEFSPVIEQISIDEAYLDTSGLEKILGTAVEIARKIKERIRSETSLTCSIGIAPNKFLAKIASDSEKPDGLTIINENQIMKFLRDLPVRKIPGIGPVTEENLAKFGILKVSDILKFPEDFFRQEFGKFGDTLIDLAKGVDESPVVSQSVIKSISSEMTFEEDTKDRELLRKWLIPQCEEVGRRLREENLKGKTITLKLKLSNFRTVTRSHTLISPTNATNIIIKNATHLLQKYNLTSKIRLIGVGVSNFQKGFEQLNLFEKSEDEKFQKIDEVIDKITDRYGTDIIKRGA